MFVVHPFASSASCFNGEIIPKWISKGKAAALVCRYFGADLKDAVAFGDSMNDAAVLELAGVAVAMGNASREVKEAADFVTGSNEEEGAAKAILRLI